LKRGHELTASLTPELAKRIGSQAWAIFVAEFVPDVRSGRQAARLAILPTHVRQVEERTLKEKCHCRLEDAAAEGVEQDVEECEHRHRARSADFGRSTHGLKQLRV
jgi:hypothetical protein